MELVGCEKWQENVEQFKQQHPHCNESNASHYQLNRNNLASHSMSSNRLSDVVCCILHATVSVFVSSTNNIHTFLLNFPLCFFLSLRTIIQSHCICSTISIANILSTPFAHQSKLFLSTQLVHCYSSHKIK